MHASDAYQLLSDAIHQIGEWSAEHLATQIKAGKVEQQVWIGTDPVEIEIRLSWGDANRQTVAIDGVVRGPSTWMHQCWRERRVLALK